LVDERGLDRGSLAIEPLRQPLRREGGAQGLDAEVLEVRMVVEGRGRDEVHEPETARVVITKCRAVAEMKHDVLMLRREHLRVDELAEHERGVVEALWRVCSLAG
jgi:hypothetical protein